MERKRKLDTKNLEQCFLGIIMIYIITYLAVVSNIELCIDFGTHASWSIQLFSGELSISDFLINKSAYPLWHIVTGVVHKFVGLNETEATATVTAFFNCFTYLGVNAVWIYYERECKQKSNTWLWSFLLMIMGPLYVPRYTQYYYLGQGTGNIWHNPTNIAVKGIAVLAFMVIGLLLQRAGRNRKWYLFLAVLLVLSALAKPSFLQGIIPGVGLYMLIKCIYELYQEKRKNHFVLECKNCLKIILAFVPAVCVVAFQFYVSFFGGEAGDGIGISYGYVLHQFSVNLFYSFLFAFIFPLTVLLIDFKNVIKDIFFQIACCYELCAWLESALIFEKGARAAHGNWLWASYLSMFIVWMVSMMRFCRYINRQEEFSYKKAIGICLGGGAFILQVLCGFFYWYNIATGKIPY